jgi:uncharacterized membrane protein (UPF0127 family)
MKRYWSVTNRTRSRRLADRAWLADHWWSRLRGLLGHGPLTTGEALMLVPCRAVHMFGMRFPLDVAFLDDRGGVIAVYHELPPGARSRWHRAATRALELPAGTLAATGTMPGDEVESLPLSGSESGSA